MTNYRFSDASGGSVIRDDGNAATVFAWPIIEGGAMALWEADGSPEPGPFVSPPVLPAPITARQIRLALLGAGLLSQVEPAIDAMPEPERSAARIEWDYASEYRHDHHLIASLAAALGLADEQIDTLWATALTL